MAKERAEVAKEDCWNVEALYPSLKDWKDHFSKVCGEKPDSTEVSSQENRWSSIAAYKGNLSQGAKVVKEALDKFFSISRQLHNLYTYAHLKHDEELTNDDYKRAYATISALLHDFSREMAWLEPELLALPDQITSSYIQSPELADYRFYLEKLLRVKKHMLSSEKEELMALAGKALSSPHKAFSAINDADFKFGTVADGKGNERELTHGSYGIYIRDQDRVLRENAFKKLHGHYLGYENTLCELLSGVIEGHFFNAKARNYTSCLEAALFEKNIDLNVYHALVQTVGDNLSGLHRYMQLRRKVLGLDALHLYDVYVPLTKTIDIKIPYGEAEDLVIESVAPLGTEYQNILRKGLKEQRWVDRYENKNKRSGAYSSGSYDSMPYILMNYKELLRDVFTLAHEAGHSMHSALSRKHQPYIYADYSIFVAEVASTFNEELLVQLLLQRLTKKEEKIFLINQKIEDIRGTLFRQTMFAEFELFLHRSVEKNIPLTPKFLKEEFIKLNRKYFGDNVVIDKEIEIEWARIPHFYYNFYVYQYATGISAALALAEGVLAGGEGEREAYFNFLKGGGSKYPIDMLKVAGIDMCSPAPVKSAIGKFDSLVSQLEKLVFSS
jgi:oligoendopeptidase F